MSRWWWIAGWAAATVLLWVADMFHPVETADPSWWLQVSDRLLAGDAPYRDFYLGVLPMPLWLTSGLMWLLGSDIAVVKLIVAASYTGTAVVAARVATASGVSPAGSALVAAASLAFVFLPSSSPYSALSYLLMMVTLALVVAWRLAGAAAGGRERLLLVAAGAAAGLSCAGKQTVGAAALAALIICILFAPPGAGRDVRSRIGDGAIAAASALAVIALCLAPVALTGGLDEMRTQAFDKGEYVSTSSIPYTDGLSELWSLLGDPISGRTQLRFHVIFLVPIAALWIFGAAAVRSRHMALIPFGAFLAAAIVPALPRAVYFKVSDALPFCALAIAVAWPHLFAGRRRPRWEPVAAGALGAACLVLAALNLARAPIAQQLVRGDVPHFGTVAMTADQRDRADRQAERLQAADGGEDRTFVFSASAGFIYLVSGLENPTDNDYPVRTTLRDTGAAEVIAAVGDGRIERICVGDFGDDPSSRVPELEHWVTANMTPELGGPGPEAVRPEECVIYSAARSEG